MKIKLLTMILLGVSLAYAQEPAPTAETQEQDDDQECQELARHTEILIEKYKELASEYMELLKIAQQQEKAIEESEQSLQSLQDEIDSTEPSPKKETHIVVDLLKTIVSTHPLGAILVTLAEHAPVDETGKVILPQLR